MGIKRLYLFLLKTFMPIFLMTFGICMFIVLMQFLWKYVDDMVGKGLEINLLAEMFFYAALSLVPLALPLAILLASLMTFGNLGEQLELLAMKSAGISLPRIMRPFIILLSFVAVGAFFFQNNIIPLSQVKMWTLLGSIRAKSPELQIPESTFSNQIEGYNLYVKKKDKDGRLNHLMIYDYSEGFNNAQVIVADSGRMKISADKQFLVLLLFEGKMFKNFNRDGIGSNEAVPYMKESFKTREMLIRFDSDFHRADESILQDRYIGKNLADLQSSIDSMTAHLDSIKQLNAAAIYRQSYRRELESARPEGDATTEQGVVSDAEIPDFDRLCRELPPGRQATILRQARNALETTKADYDFKAAVLSSDEKEMRRHHTEMHQKFTLSFACLIFFFIGAPLGAIIRKGGLGMPVVISIFLFIFYYVINNIGLKMASNGMWQPWQGMWLSSAVLLPLGVFLTYKASNDSVILNADTYIEGLKKLIGKRATRKIEKKEVIMFHVDYTAWEAQIECLKAQCETYLKRSKRWMPYFRFWEQGGKDPEAKRISVQLEELVAEGNNSDRHLVLNKLMDYPILNGYHLINFRISPTAGKILGWLFPIGLPIYLLATYRRKLLLHDIRTIAHVSNELLNILKK
ncbi:LptF/LptG family permease [Tannerella sp.]|uniref:LptF/LptG family permease n=1 Tax=Tannerella sp. TaxID=2382127 RepID=UPI0026DCCE3B|nr:LptF/LptG family permease [Tannerella sp.]MDO4704266.1 LptF/LptG family permease [Tannerella sp.]